MRLTSSLFPKRADYIFTLCIGCPPQSPPIACEDLSR
nr:MAG TPA: hypothetical protein [Bacteriophage sp.]DAZ24602.1 MAG TPA: hypothetical protein [Caudoviricetes sp.]